MVSSCVVVRADPGRDGILVAAGDQRIHEPPAAAAAEVVVAEAEATEVSHVVGQREIVADEGPGPLAAALRVGVQHHGLLRRQDATGPESLPRQGGVLGRHQVGMCRARAGPGQSQHPGAKRRQHPLLRGHRRRGRIQRVQVLLHFPIRAGVRPAHRGLDQGRMAAPEPEQEPRAEVRRQASAPAGQLRWVVHPYIQDSGRDGNPPGRSQEVLDLAEHIAPRIRDEDRRVPQILELGGRGSARAPIRVVPELTAPDPHFAQVNRHACVTSVGRDTVGHDMLPIAAVLSSALATRRDRDSLSRG